MSHKGSPQNTGRGVPFPFPGNLPNPRIEPTSLMSPALAGGLFTTSTTWEALCVCVCVCVYTLSESEVAQSCPTLSNPMDCSLPGSSAHGIFQARVLEWGAIAFSDIYTYSAYNYYQLSKIFSMIQASLSKISPSHELEHIGLPRMSWYFYWMIFSVSQPL